MSVGKPPEEWLKQATYDIETAECLFNNRRYYFAVFTCHLAVEKALKGAFARKLADIPPHTHSLVYLRMRARVELPADLADFLSALDQVSVPTRYPEELDRLLRDYDRARTESIVTRSRRVVEWVSRELSKS